MGISSASSERVSQPATGAHAWGVLWVLCFVYVLNFLDRQLLSILAKPIQDSLHVTDGQLGLIGGLYFAVFYCFIAVPVGWFADRTDRVTVLSLACAIWSAATRPASASTTSRAPNHLAAWSRNLSTVRR
jgi:MFS family permease